MQGFIFCLGNVHLGLRKQLACIRKDILAVIKGYIIQTFFSVSSLVSLLWTLVFEVRQISGA